MVFLAQNAAYADEDKRKIKKTNYSQSMIKDYGRIDLTCLTVMTKCSNPQPFCLSVLSR